MTKELDLHSPSSCPQIVVNSRELLSALSFYSIFPPMTCLNYEVDDRSYVHVEFDYHVKSKNGEQDGNDEVVLASQEERALLHCLETSHSDHMILHYELELINHLRKYSGNEVTFKFYHLEVDAGGTKVGHEIQRPFKLKSCGVYLHFDENLLADTDLP
jgi:hypothetical protein